MGFDLTGIKAKNTKGEYFRNNVWYWRRLWEFVEMTCSTILSEEDIIKGNFNDGHKITAKKADQMVIILKKSIKDGFAKKYSDHVSEEIKIAKANNKTHKMGDPKHNWNESYPFTIINLKEFITFVENSGGFRIY